MAPPVINAQSYSTELLDLSIDDRLEFLCTEFEGRKVFTSSFGKEDQIITHIIFSRELDIEVVTLDTGRMFAETYDVWAATEKRYGKKITPFYPNNTDVEKMIANQGINGFYGGIEQRKACCFVRKVEPLKRALEGAALWITGIRSQQSNNRKDMTIVEYDESRKLYKTNPLLELTSKDVDLYLTENANIPTNKLHATGYPSIGCQPCTRAVKPGEDDRAGRWWWENNSEQECGLHVGPDGRLVRTKIDKPTDKTAFE